MEQRITELEKYGLELEKYGLELEARIQLFEKLTKMQRQEV